MGRKGSSGSWLSALERGQGLAGDGEPRDQAADGEQAGADQHRLRVRRVEGHRVGVLVTREPDRHGQGRDGAVLAIHLSVHVLDKVIAELTPHYGGDCPVAVVWRASWPDEKIVRATLATLDGALGDKLERTALILVGRTLGAAEFAESRLYAADYDRRYRPTGPTPRFPEKSR